MNPWVRCAGAVFACGIGAAACQTAAVVNDAPRAARVDDGEGDLGTESDNDVVSAEAYRAVLESELRAQQGDLDGAVELLREASLHDPGSVYLHVRLGEAALARGDASSAKVAAEAALSRRPDDLNALRLLGTALASAGERSAAQAVFERALRQRPGDRRTSLLLAELKVEQGDLDGAERVIESLMNQEEGAVDGYVALARVFAERGLVDRAFVHADRALARDDKNVDALLLRVDLLRALGRFDEALATSTTLAKERGDSADTRFDLLVAHTLAGRDVEATRLAQSWLEDDESEGMRLVIADAYERSGQLEQALQATTPKDTGGRKSPRLAAEGARLSLALRRPSEAAARVCPAVELASEARLRDWTTALCARALTQADDVKAALQRLTRALSASVEAGAPSARLVSALADTVRDAGVVAPSSDEALANNVGAAVALIDAARVKAPEDAQILDAAARVREHRGDAAGARALFDAALRLRPSDPDLLLAYARLLDRQGDALGAVDIVERLMERSDDPDVDLLNFAAFALAEEGVRADDARRYAWRAVVRDPLNGYVLDTLGWAQFRAGDVDQALATLLRADRLAPTEAEIWFHIAQVQRAQGKLDDARAAVGRAHDYLQAADAPLRGRIEALSRELSLAGRQSGLLPLPALKPLDAVRPSASPRAR